MLRSGTTTRTTLVALGVAAALAGCGSSGGAPAPSSPSPNGEQSKTAQQVLADTKAALVKATSVHVKGALSQQGQSQRIDLQFQGQDAVGSVGVGGAVTDVVRTAGKTYLKGPAAFWSRVAGPAGAKLADKWIVVDDASGNAPGLSLQSLAGALNTQDANLVPQVATGTVDGRPSVVVSQQDGSTISVAGTGTPYPLRLDNKGAAAGTLTFSDYGKTVPVVAPAGAVTPQQAAAAPGATPSS